MPKVDMDYSKTIIYKIVCRDVTIKDLYVGQTTNFTKRKCKHKSICNNIYDRNHNYYIYQFIREHGGWINFDMIEVENYDAVDKLDAHKRERYWIEQLNATLNKVVPTRTLKEYKIDNQDKIKQNSKEYYEDNKDTIKEYFKEFYEKNKNKFKEKNKDYYEQNKEQLKETITCICGSVCSKINLKRHEQTKKHMEFVKTI